MRFQAARCERTRRSTRWNATSGRVWTIAVGLLLLTAVGCRHVRPPAIVTGERATTAPEAARGLRSAVVSLYAEADATTLEAVSWELPMSGVVVACDTEPLVNTGELLNVAVAPLELGTALEIQLARPAQRAVHAFITVPDPGRLVLVFDGKALGAARVRSVDATGRITLFVEVPEDRLPELVSDLRAAVAAAR